MNEEYNKSHNLTESMLRETFIEWLKSEGLTDFVKEMQIFNGGSIHDLIYVDKERKFICVEFKLTDWKKVVEQACIIRTHTPLVYVAMPLPATLQKRNAIETIIERNGLGLFWFNKHGDWKVQLAPNEKLWIGKEEWIHYFNKRLETALFQHYHFTFIAPHLGRAAEISKTVVYKTKKVIW